MRSMQMAQDGAGRSGQRVTGDAVRAGVMVPG
jgi:hypothetical protein